MSEFSSQLKFGPQKERDVNWSEFSEKERLKAHTLNSAPAVLPHLPSHPKISLKFRAWGNENVRVREGHIPLWRGLGAGLGFGRLVVPLSARVGRAPSPSLCRAACVRRPLPLLALHAHVRLPLAKEASCH